jgi:hypothetical protein
MIVATAAEAAVGVVLLDVVLGYASHPDPGGALVPAVSEAQAVARAAGREMVFVASVCGTERDPQGLAGQERALRDAGVLLAPSNARAADLAARVVGAVEPAAAVVAG